jgi:tetratricopeptide (TPR) repeat protein
MEAMKDEQIDSRLAGSHRLREAEGLIDLITRPAARLGLATPLRRQIARRVLRLVGRLSVPNEMRWRRALLIGQAFRLLGNYEAAIAPLWFSVKHYPEGRDSWLALGWCLKRSGQLDRAASVLARAVTHIPDDAVLHFNFACYLACLGQADLAVAELLWALDLNPDLRNKLAQEPDFESIRGHATFRALAQPIG